MFLTKAEQALYSAARSWCTTRFTSCRDVCEITYQGLIVGLANAQASDDPTQAATIRGILLKLYIDRPQLAEAFITFEYSRELLGRVGIDPDLQKIVTQYRKKFGRRGFGCWYNNPRFEWIIFCLAGSVTGIVAVYKKDLADLRNLLKTLHGNKACTTCTMPVQGDTCLLCGTLQVNLKDLDLNLR